ncbi:hypothetical protein CHRYSEOSP005_04820 [Chryseobacterium sp. Alg-005]|uniref:T9SS type A sorting domain-containing protein n=1 Tax=Chryseobacterium sp. Alg-005 TaxID=3159516 RepID=UPI0035559DA6
MKTIYFILLIFTGTLLSAQPVITSADMVTGTFSYTDVEFNQGVYTAGSGGANMTWDFSNVQGTTGGGTLFYGVCPGIPECSSFPTANRYVTALNPNGTQTDDKNLFRVDNAQYEVLGGRNAVTNSTTAYTDTAIELKFPTTYLQSFTDTSSLTNNGATSSTNDVITADGYGTIITPIGTYTNTLRVKKVSTLTSSLNGIPVSTTQVTTYTWYKNNREQIASFTDTNIISPISQPGPSSFTYTNSSALATQENTIEKSLSIYPNPVKDGKIWIEKLPGTHIKSIGIYDMAGKRISEESESVFKETNGKYFINLQDYPDGNYIMRVETDKSIFSHIIQIKQK